MLSAAFVIGTLKTDLTSGPSKNNVWKQSASKSWFDQWAEQEQFLKTKRF